eukprot:SAG31_NODE_2996_length_4803_cov_8.948342_8_plen_79_part_00
MGRQVCHPLHHNAAWLRHSYSKYDDRQPLQPHVPRPNIRCRHCFGAVVHDEHMWIIGGDNSHGPYQTDVWKSPDGTTW